MHRKLPTIPALLLASFATLAIAPAHASPATALKEVTVGNERLIELTNQGQQTLKVVTHRGYDRANEVTPTDNGIVELFVEPGKSIVVKGTYDVYEYYPTPAYRTILSYPNGG